MHDDEPYVSVNDLGLGDPGEAADEDAPTGADDGQARTGVRARRLLAAMLALLLVGAVGIWLAVRAAVTQFGGDGGFPLVTAENAPSYFSQHRQDFAGVVDAVTSGSLGDPDTWVAGGTPLPVDLCDLSATCRVGNIDSASANPAARARRAAGVAAAPQLYLWPHRGQGPSGEGWLHLEAAPSAASRFDNGQGVVICPTLAVGDGWWFVDACPA